MVLARLLLRLGDVDEASFFGLGSSCCSSILEEAGIAIVQVWRVKALCLRHLDEVHVRRNVAESFRLWMAGTLSRFAHAPQVT